MFNIKELTKNSVVQKIFKSTAIYTGGNFLLAAIPFILLPVLTRVFTPEDYGILATFMAVFNIVQMIIYMGTTDAIMRAYFDREKKDFDFSSYVFNAISVNIAVFFLVLAIWGLFKEQLIQFIPVPYGYQLLIPIAGFCAAVAMIQPKLYILRKEPVQYAIISVSNTILEVSVSILLVVLVGLSWRGRVWGLVLSGAVFAGVSLYLIYRKGFLRVKIKKEYFLSVVQYGFPVVLHSLGFVVIVAIERFFLNNYIGLSATGLYSVSYSICSILTYLTGAFNASWLPHVYERLGSPTKAYMNKLVKFTYFYFLLIIIATFCFIILLPHILSIIVGTKFLESKIFIVWLAMSFGFHSMYTTVATYVFYSKKTYVMSRIAITTVVLSIIFNFILIHFNGAIGVAQAACLVSLSRFLMVWFFANKTYPMPWLSFYKKC